MKTALAGLLLVACAFADDDLDALVRDLGSPQYAVRDRAYKTLIDRKDARVLPKIEKRLPDLEPENQYRALLVVGAFPPRQSHPILQRLLKSKDPHLRICGATQLQRRGERGMEAVIAATLREPIPERMLRPVVARVSYLRLPSVYEAWRALITPDRDALTLAIWFAALSSEEYAGAQAQAKRIVEEDKRSGARAVACGYLIRCGDGSYAPELGRIIREQPLDSSSASRIRYLLRDGRLYPAEVCDAMLERLAHEDNAYVAKTYIEVLAAARHYAARKPLARMVEHRDPRIAEAALGALAELDGVPDPEVVRRMLESPDEKRQLMAARILRRLDDASGFEVVRTLAQKSLSPSTRREACTLLGEFRRADGIDLLIERMSDTDTMVRYEAQRSLLSTLTTLFPYRRFDLESTGYRYRDSAAQREPAVEMIRAWWHKHRKAGW